MLVLDRRRQLRPALEIAAVMACAGGVVGNLIARGGALQRVAVKPEFLLPAGSVRIFGADRAAKLIRHPRAMTGRHRRGPHRFRHDQAVTARLSAGRDVAQASASARRMTVFLPSFFALMRPRFTSS